MSKHYKTARFTEQAIAIAKYAGQDGLPTGYVRVKQIYEAMHNAYIGKVEAVYSVYRDMTDLSYLGMYYESALTEFCL